MKKITLFTAKYFVFIALLALAPLSKYPSVSLPLFNFSSFRLGFYQILALFFIGLFFWNKDYKFLKNNKPALLGLLLVAFSVVVGGFFAIDRSRWALLGSSVIMLLLLLVAAWGFVAENFNKIEWEQLFKVVMVAGIAISVLAIIQFIVNSFTTEDFGILCKNCVGSVFGFPRVNLFSAEPQFLANSLLPVLFISLFVFVNKKSKLALFSLVLSSLVIGLTFSRGAFIALAAGIIAYWVFGYKNIKRLAGGSLVIILSILLAIVLLITSASIKYRSVENITYDTTNTVLQQLTLGIISLPEKQVAVVVSTPPTNAVPTNTTTEENFESPGLIEESGNERLEAAKLALQTWTYTVKNIIIGTGLGNLGPFVVNNINSSAPANLTVYIFFVLVIAEMGILGFVGFLLLLISPVVILVKKYRLKQPAFMPVVIAVIVAFAVQYTFFGSYINVVYIWLWLGIVAALASLSQKQLSNLIK